MSYKEPVMGKFYRLAYLTNLGSSLKLQNY
jgi:hypothetical protein